MKTQKITVVSKLESKIWNTLYCNNIELKIFSQISMIGNDLNEQIYECFHMPLYRIMEQKYDR